MQILHGTRTAGPISVKLPDWRGFGAVERFSTLVPFSFNRRPTNVVREQFWGRAARAFLTRKSRNARFIFHVVFDSSLACQALPAERK
jgi:hypothetical protein